MKKHLPLFLLIIGCCLIHYVLLGQDSIGKIYSIKFSGYKANLSKEAPVILLINDIARSMKNQPGCNLAVIGYCGATENQRLNQTNWDRINKIINRFIKKHGVNADRLIFNYGTEGRDWNSIDLKFTEETPSTDDPPPNPNLLRKNQ